MSSHKPYEGSRRQALHLMDRRLQQFRAIDKDDRPPEGWIHEIRTVIRMPQRDLAERLSISEQAVKQIEQREVAGTISLKLLEKAADAMGLDLVYGFVPRATSLESMVEAQILKYIRKWQDELSSKEDVWIRKRIDRLLEKPQGQFWWLTTRVSTRLTQGFDPPESISPPGHPPDPLSPYEAFLARTRNP